MVLAVGVVGVEGVVEVAAECLKDGESWPTDLPPGGVPGASECHLGEGGWSLACCAAKGAVLERVRSWPESDDSALFTLEEQSPVRTWQSLGMMKASSVTQSV